MGKFVNLAKGFTGLDNRNAPESLQEGDLSVASNVYVSSDRTVARRKGYTATSRTEKVDSIWADKDICLFESSNNLYLLNADFSKKGLRNDVGSGILSCVRIQDKVYYVNGIVNGYVVEGASWAWIMTDTPNITDQIAFSNPPVGQKLEVYNGRMYIASGETLFYSWPFAYSAFALKGDYITFPSRILMVRAVDDGLFVGVDSFGVYFLGGMNPREFLVRQISSSPPIEGTDVTVDNRFFMDGSLEGKVVMWTSATGIFFGTDSGGHGQRAKFGNISSKQLIYPSGSRGCGVSLKEKYLCLIH